MVVARVVGIEVVDDARMVIVLEGASIGPYVVPFGHTLSQHPPTRHCCGPLVQVSSVHLAMQRQLSSVQPACASQSLVWSRQGPQSHTGGPITEDTGPPIVRMLIIDVSIDIGYVHVTILLDSVELEFSRGPGQ